MCLYPRLVQNPKYKPNKKNKGKVPKMKDNRVAAVPIACGRCMECRKKKARNWKIRLTEELENNNGIFVTMTFSDDSLIRLEESLRQKGFDLEGYELDNAMAKLAVKRFSDRFKAKYGRRPRRWMVTELGSRFTERVHLHGIIFENMSWKELDELWTYGNVWVGQFCNEQSIGYIVKYLHKVDMKHKNYTPAMFYSPGLGKGWTEKYHTKKLHSYQGEDTRDNYRFRNGSKVAMPIYYRNKMYSDEEREDLWLQKLDKNERWIMGTKVDLDHPKARELERNLRGRWQKESERLGFGSDKKDWSEESYERQRRILLHRKRNKG